MEPLHPIPQCVDCLRSLAKDIATSAALEDPRIIERAEQISRDIIEASAGIQVSSPQIANRILREIRHITRIDDPYADFKAGEMAQAREIMSELAAYESGNLRVRASLAVLGNSLDFFKNPALALADIPHQIRSGISFYCDNLDQLEAFLATKPRRVLYLTDNAGEVYFDIPFYDFIKQYCRQIYLVVKGGPALNDLTRAELRSAKLEHRFERVADTGTDGAGIDWNNVSEEFLDLMDAADLIVSKGMANFETLYPKSISMPSFYLFKVKCEPIQNFIEAPVNSFMALWKDGNPE